MTISPNISVEDFSNAVGSIKTFPNLIIGFFIWLSRIIGVVVIIWGVYALITARKDGNADEMNGAMARLILGGVLAVLPTVLSAVGIIGSVTPG